ncbi:MAG: LLM class flavin-dependent oxidoreductase [Candidatus Hodarchaeota archaeon]
MKFGINLVCFPNLNDRWTPDFYIQCASLAEESGWDGVFIWDHIWAYWEGESPTFDPWILLAGMASHTDEVRLGPMVTPLARRRPWKLARETVTLDHLSDGRLILGIGLGGEAKEFSLFGEDANPIVRAEKLDEALTILKGLWTGKPFQFRGTHYQLEEVTFTPPPIQKPRIPIWVAGYYPNTKPFQRAAEFEGVFPTAEWGVDFSPSELEQVLRIIQRYRSNLDQFDVVVSPNPLTDENELCESIRKWAEAGATWWLDILSSWRGSASQILRRIEQGPPDL